MYVCSSMLHFLADKDCYIFRSLFFRIILSPNDTWKSDRDRDIAYKTKITIKGILFWIILVIENVL